ncbi:DUF6429 family protein [Orenia marismortui]|uniref:DUF6429 family protein n=1 Tax=Orenia marismortui TaxID=46469 RepID=UPI000363B888|nr:DUF6429 family protein [Orenia marismortui]
MKEKIKELTLLLLYLTSWEEDDFPEDVDVKRSWKGYPFEILDELREEDFIFGSSRAKSVYIKEKGIEEAKKLMEKYINQEEN